MLPRFWQFCMAAYLDENVSKHKKLKSRIVDIVSVCCALLRGRTQRMNLLQRIISIVLYCGHTSKRVSSLNEGMKMFVINGISFDFAHARFIPGCKNCVFASPTMPLTSVLRSLVVILMHLWSNGETRSPGEWMWYVVKNYTGINAEGACVPWDPPSPPWDFPPSLGFPLCVVFPRGACPQIPFIGCCTIVHTIIVLIPVLLFWS